MSIAFIADIHANREALDAVLADIDRQRGRYGITDIVSLGDMVNYGPNPKEVVGRMRKLAAAGDYNVTMLKGNHDEAVGNPDNLELLATFNDIPQEAALWTRKQLSKDDLKFLRNLPFQYKHNGVVAAHGTFCDKLEDGETSLEMTNYTLYCGNTPCYSPNVARCFASLPEKTHACFVGHMQVSEGWVDTKQGIKHFSFRAENQTKSVSLAIDLKDGERYVIDVGAVGQPRDGDKRASYGIYAGKSYVNRRIPYDFKKTTRRIAAVGLNDCLATRLKVGY